METPVIPLCQRTYPLSLASEYVSFYRRYAYWLRELLYRLGYAETICVWKYAFQKQVDDLLTKILSSGWRASDGELDFEIAKSKILQEYFSKPVEDVMKDAARKLIDSAQPFCQIETILPSINVIKDVKAWEAIHLFYSGLAQLTEALIDLHGKEGEFVAHNIAVSWVGSNPRPIMSAEEFLAIFKLPVDRPCLQWAALEYELIRATGQDVLIHIKECEWARYFRQIHPKVGYLLICSMDELDYRAVNPSIRVQRTSTLMEGGKLCDFRIYALEDMP